MCECSPAGPMKATNSAQIAQAGKAGNGVKLQPNVLGSSTELSVPLFLLCRIVSELAHELTQPLAGVRGLSEHLLLAMQRNWDLSKDQIQNKLKRIIEQSDRVLDTVDQFRALMDQSSYFVIEKVDPNEIVRTSVATVRDDFQHNGLHVHCSLTTDIPHVLTNSPALKNVMLDFLMKLRHSVVRRADGKSESTSTCISICTRPASTASRSQVEIQVANEGNRSSKAISPPPSDREASSFDSGSRCDLALLFSRAIVEQLGGTFQTEPVSDTGTKLSVMLPACLEVPQQK